MYKVPDSFYFRIHHVRPRFKNNIENVLIFLAEEIEKIGTASINDFKLKLNNAIRIFPGNINRTEKTINNWRTEISSLFGFFIELKSQGITKAGQRALDLSQKQDLVQFFKTFLYFFQYPGGYIKSHENLKYIEKGISFKPVITILKLLKISEEKTGKRIGITKAEATHLLFNDLRATANLEDIHDTAKRFVHSKEKKYCYDWTGDVIRYAGDILDYMEIANLLKSYNGLFYLNSLEKEIIDFFINSFTWFDGYDEMIKDKSGDIEQIKFLQTNWYQYVNTPVEENFFNTDILALISEDEDEYKHIQEGLNSLFERADLQELRTKEIGDLGESLTYGHECKRITLAGREDLMHLIKIIPTSFSVGYDIQSVEIDEIKRYIEVKTTISNRAISFHRFHLTPNEWNAAKSLADRYFVYRLYINKKEKRLYILQDPEKLYKESKIDMSLNRQSGTEITFNPEASGEYQELLTWKN